MRYLLTALIVLVVATPAFAQKSEEQRRRDAKLAKHLGKIGNRVADTINSGNEARQVIADTLGETRVLREDVQESNDMTLDFESRPQGGVEQFFDWIDSPGGIATIVGGGTIVSGLLGLAGYKRGKKRGLKEAEGIGLPPPPKASDAEAVYNRLMADLAAFTHSGSNGGVSGRQRPVQPTEN